MIATVSVQRISQVIRADARRFRPLALWLGWLVLAGCRTAAPLPVSPSTDAEVRKQLLTELARWEGTPHQWGGLDERGIDCSGLVMRVYQEAFGLTLPRTTETQVQIGRRVSRQELQAGDLVFFRLDSQNRHVGIYLGDGRFFHAASSTGVTVSDLDTPYWQRHYWTARRILHLEQRRTSIQASSPSVGW